MLFSAVSSFAFTQLYIELKSSTPPSMPSPGNAFRALLRSRRAAGKTDGSLILPGCFDGIVARMAVNKGFQGLYLSGGGTSALTGVPDVGVMACTDFEYKIRNISKIIKELKKIKNG